MKNRSILKFFQLNKFILLLNCLSITISLTGKTLKTESGKQLKVDFKYAPQWWQSTICLPDDPLKTVVGKEGQLFYDFVRSWEKETVPGPYRKFNTMIEIVFPENFEWKSQTMHSPKIPIIKTLYESEEILVTEEVFSVAPPFILDADSTELNYLGHKHERNEIFGAPRNDLIIIHYYNKSDKDLYFSPAVNIHSKDSIIFMRNKNLIKVGRNLNITSIHNIQDTSFTKSFVNIKNIDISLNKLQIIFSPINIKPKNESFISVGVNIGEDALIVPQNSVQPIFLRNQAERYWQNRDLPYNQILVPDSLIQALIYSSIRNIYQAREIKNGLPVFQVGPTFYRDLWIVDGAFLLEAMTFLGQIEDVRNGIDYILSFQKNDGSFMLIDGHWKETGIVLWALTRHAMLTGDKEWLQNIWFEFVAAVNFILKMRELTMIESHAPNTGLIPKGYSDGGLKGKHFEYTNIYWTLAGMKAAVRAAKWLQKENRAGNWRKEYNRMYKTFCEAAKRDMKKDEHGNEYLPIRMTENEKVLPQKAQWAFLHAVFPGKIFSKNNHIVQGNLEMLKSTEREGLVQSTGWLDEGIWNYFGSFYGHALLWIGEGQLAARKLYAMANHASPTLVWREEQSVKASDEFNTIGDMPHNWASAEFIRLVRHLLILERGNKLHLFEGLPREWARPSMVSRLNNIYTEFGMITLKLEISNNGKEANCFIDFDSSNHRHPSKVIIHLLGISGKEETLELPGKFPIRRSIKI
jgi:hypothetical protein